MKKLPEILFCLALAGGMLVPSALAGQWWLFGTFLVFFICFGIGEGISVKVTGKTISQHFWAYSKVNKKMAWIVLVGMAVGWAALLLHLGAKLL